MMGQWSNGPTKMWSILSFMLILASCVNAERRTFEKAENRTFEINYEENSFWMDGEPFRYVSGSLHYFRSPHETWRDRLRTLRSSGLNAVSTYVEWSFHEPERGQFRWTGDHDLVNFIQIAQEEDLYVILRPGPYICAERDMGGFPYWLLNLYPNIQLRTDDLDYKREVTKWYAELMYRLEPLFYGNGGPIITVQVENEYGFFYACDQAYMSWLSEITYFWVQDTAVLFTTDGPQSGSLTCGSAPGAYSTVDFGTGQNVTQAWEALREISPRGPLVNSEFYPGWMTHWGDQPARVSSEDIVRSLETMMADNANVNFYMFHGGTNFEYSAGANSDPYTADVTSYDYDAPMTEAGDPTSKYFAIRDVLLKYLPEPPYPPPEVKAKWSSDGPLILEPAVSLMGPSGRQRFGRPTIQSYEPPTMEQVSQSGGLILYETVLTSSAGDLALLTLNDLRDRALIYLDGEFIGALSRHQGIYSLPIIASAGHSIQILVENQGRINFGSGINDFKGVVGNITYGNSDVFNWDVTSYPLESVGGMWAANDSLEVVTEGTLRGGPVFYTSHFLIGDVEDVEPLDTYLDMTGWGKGFVWINGRHLGRYWPGEGPQVTLYVPGVYLSPYPAENFLSILELQSTPFNQTVSFIDYPIGI